MLIDGGDLVPSNGGWVLSRGLSSIKVPPTIRAILAARLDNLPAAERAAGERASVVGKVFFLGAVEELTPAAERSGVRAALMSLVRKDFVRPTASTFANEDAFGFRHQLIPGCRVRRPAEGAEGRPSRRGCRLARAGCRRPRRGAGRDRRLPPRAGVPLSRVPRTGGKRRYQAGSKSRIPPRGRRTPCVRSRGRGGRKALQPGN